jgi:uncharacterized protein YchJ
MHSRYYAYVEADIDYLEDTHDPRQPQKRHQSGSK